MDASLHLVATVDPVGLVVAAGVVILTEAAIRRRRAARGTRQDAE
jgi:hypothetical protein